MKEIFGQQYTIIEKIARFFNAFALGMYISRVSMIPYDLDDYIWITLNGALLTLFIINDVLGYIRNSKN